MSSLLGRIKTNKRGGIKYFVHANAGSIITMGLLRREMLSL
jgi:hypothetical protein